MVKGYTHVYTGPGKGKTTAALGLTLRAAGAGLKVCFIQFLKGGTSAEHKMLKKLPGVTLQQYGQDGFVGRKPAARDLLAARRGLAALRRALASEAYDLVVADEICVAEKLGLLQLSKVVDVMQEKPPAVELVLTGRQAAPEIKRRADLVTVMQEKKHYFRRGVKARKGIEY
ncbi:cob(I)yrinic acid a,c-diamide adenosyltransferase [candidate division FCPU426 bacterium]|nr:cob(I)yrinic acid a,c-diamide adenosyltransferase [candidate division FCPU426 bacterium]